MFRGEGDTVSQGVIARVPGKNPERNPEGKSRKVGLGSQRDRNEDGPGRRCSWSLFSEKVGKFDKFIKNTKSRKVPGRESREFRKASRKGIFMNHAQRE